MEDMIFITLFVAVPVTLLTMGFIAVLNKEKQQVNDHPKPGQASRKY